MSPGLDQERWPGATTTAHLRRLRWLAAVALVMVAGAVTLGFVLEPRRSLLASPSLVTLVTLAASLWLAATANGDARGRLERVKRAYAATGDPRALLQGHLLVYAVVLLRLLVVAVAGVISAVWGRGPGLSLPFFALAAAMIALTWPTHHKLRLLIDRAERLRG